MWSLDERKRMVARPMTNVFPSGRKEVFKLRLASGREVEATANHPFMTFDGWTPLGELKVGDRVAVPRRVPEPVQTAADARRRGHSAGAHDRRRLVCEASADPVCERSTS